VERQALARRDMAWDPTRSSRAAQSIYFAKGLAQGSGAGGGGCGCSWSDRIGRGDMAGIGRGMRRAAQRRTRRTQR
jgi:hypothetical protein